MAENAARVGAGRTVLVSGASGFVGRFLCEYLAKREWRVKRLVRREPKGNDEVGWDPERLRVDDGAFADVYGVVHLAGESVAGRWTEAKKSSIASSRVNGTRTLAQAIRTAALAPQVFVSASAIGYYGDRGDEILTEESEPQDDFLAKVCIAWEEESKAVDGTCRRVNPRIGIVFGPDGGALEQMVRPIRWGQVGKRTAMGELDLAPGSRQVVRVVSHRRARRGRRECCVSRASDECQTHPVHRRRCAPTFVVHRSQVRAAVRTRRVFDRGAF